MTGFGQGSASLPSGEQVAVELRTVNHRHADLRCKVCPELAEHTTFVEERVRRRLLRGRGEITVRLSGGSAAAPQLDQARARAAYRQVLALRDEIDPGGPAPLSLLGSVPGLYAQAGSLDEQTALSALGEAIDGAVASLNEMRAREGESLVQDLKARLAIVGSHVSWVEDHRPQLLEGLRGRVRSRVEALLEGTGARLDGGRLEQEIALLAERSDVAEEITRLRSHLAQFESLLESAAEPVGRRLDFLLQEMNREVNTLGSKGNDAQVAQRVVELKAELERLREQVQNVL